MRDTAPWIFEAVGRSNKLWGGDGTSTEYGVWSIVRSTGLSYGGWEGGSLGQKQYDTLIGPEWRAGIDRYSAPK